MKFGEVLTYIVRVAFAVAQKAMGAYLGRVANLEEAGSAIEDCG